MLECGRERQRLVFLDVMAGPGSAAHRFAKSYALRCVRGTSP
jgi:hypothetical protein